MRAIALVRRVNRTKQSNHSNRFIVNFSIMFFSACFIAMLVGFHPSAAANEWEPSNHVVNPSYETVANGIPSNWTRFTLSGTLDIRTDADVAKDGSKSVRLSAAVSARGTIIQSIPATEHTDYDLSFWIKTDNIVSSDMGTTVRIQYFDSNEVKIGDSLYAGSWKGTRDWTKVDYNLRTPANTASISLENFIWNATGTVWFDGISLSESLHLTKLLTNEHPRLLATAADFLTTKQIIESDAQAYSSYQKIKAKADSLLTTPVVAYNRPDNYRLLAVSKEVQRRIYTLGLVYRLYGDPVYAERAWTELEAVSQFEDWNPLHFLDTSEMTHAFAIGYDWFYDYFDNTQKSVVRHAIIDLGLTPGLAEYAGNWWTKYPNNWNLVNNGGLAMGALAIGDEPSAQAISEQVLRKGLNSMQIAVDVLAPDGGWYEGYGYWNYATHYLSTHLAALKSALGTDFGLSLKPGIAETGWFPIYLESPANLSFNFADTPSTFNEPPQLQWLARQFGQPGLNWFHPKSTDDPQGLLWYRPAAYAGPEAEDLPLDKYFSNAEVATFRSAWEDSKALYVGFKGTHEDRSHKHLDAGSFVLDALGIRWATLLSADDYNLPGMTEDIPVSAMRWKYYRNRAEGSNTLVINPDMNADQQHMTRAEMTAFESSPGEAFAITDLTPLYSGNASKVMRGVKLLDHRRQVLIQDEIITPEPSDIWWFMHTSTEVQEISADGKTAILLQNGKRLWANILSPQGEFTVMDPIPLLESPSPAGQNSNPGIRKLAIHMPDTQHLQLSVLMVPLREWELPPTERPAVVPLSEWQLTEEPTSLLSSIQIDGNPLSGFNDTTFTYDEALLESPSSVPVITASAADPNATVLISQAASVPGTAWIEVTNPGSLMTTRYAVHFNTSAASDDALPVTAITASTHDGNVPENSLDNNYATRWSAEGDGQWIMYDLGELTALRSVSVAWYKGNERTTSFALEVSEDGISWIPTYSGISSGLTADLENYDIGNHMARYVRIVGYGNAQNDFTSVVETRIYNELMTPDVPSDPLSTIILTAPNSIMQTGESLNLVVTGTTGDGSPADLSDATIKYVSSDESVIRVSTDGVAEAVGDGTVKIGVMVSKGRYVKLASLNMTAQDPNKLSPIHDSYVRDGTYANNNYGKESILNIKSSVPSFSRLAYFQFDLGSLTAAPIASATLYVYGNVPDNDGSEVDVYAHPVTDDQWTETGITWNNRPEMGAEIGVKHMTDALQWYEIDITDYIQAEAAGDKIASLALRQWGTGYIVTLNSRENSQNRPYLGIEFVQDETPPTVAIEYNSTELTRDAVVASMISDEDVMITNNGGSSQYTFLYNGSYTFEFVDAAGNPGSATATVSNILSSSVDAPGQVILSDDNGHETGILDGNYTISMNLWWGNNGRVYRLYENDVLIDTQILADDSPNAQTTVTSIAGKSNGVYRYYAELTNEFGTSRSQEQIVTVTQAAPATPVLSYNNWDQSGNYTISMNMWWGTNGSVYNLYENDVLIDTQILSEEYSPQAQLATTIIANRPIGTYAYRGELVNGNGSASSDITVVDVMK
jgi:hypothetical protein